MGYFFNFRCNFLRAEGNSVRYVSIRAQVPLIVFINFQNWLLNVELYLLTGFNTFTMILNNIFKF